MAEWQTSVLCLKKNTKISSLRLNIRVLQHFAKLIVKQLSLTISLVALDLIRFSLDLLLDFGLVALLQEIINTLIYPVESFFRLYARLCTTFHFGFILFNHPWLTSSVFLTKNVVSSLRVFIYLEFMRSVGSTVLLVIYFWLCM